MQMISATSKYIGILFLVMGLAACSASRSSTEASTTISEDSEETNESVADTNPNNLNLSDFRSTLSDVYSTRADTIPAYFTQVREITEEQKDPYQGFRIQIYSGEEVEVADTLAMNFRVWSDSTLVDYDPETYVFFKTPYYRLHVGDFHERDRADEFAKIVKRVFRDAWVVYDRVNPNRVPADTTQLKVVQE